VKQRLLAQKKMEALRKLSLMNATNTNKIPQCHRDFYMAKETKKLLQWAQTFESLTGKTS